MVSKYSRMRFSLGCWRSKWSRACRYSLYDTHLASSLVMLVSRAAPYACAHTSVTEVQVPNLVDSNPQSPSWHMAWHTRSTWHGMVWDTGRQNEPWANFLLVFPCYLSSDLQEGRVDLPLTSKLGHLLVSLLNTVDWCQEISVHLNGGNPV